MASYRLQDLPPEWAHFCLSIHKFVQKETDIALEGRKLLLAFSGGPDSTALLRVFHFLAPGLNVEITAAHVHHGLRPEAEQEWVRVKELCANKNIPLVSCRIDVRSFARRKKKGLEESSRMLRYRFLRSAARKTGAEYILTGHNLNDLAEDIIMRMQRGSGWPALAGMQAYVPELKLLRPLLFTSKRKILEFLNVLGQDYALDSSNLDPAFLRNRIRMIVLPELESINPGFLKNMATLWKLGREDECYWKDVLNRIWQNLPADKDFLPGDVLIDTSRTVRLRLYKKMLDALGPGQALAENIFELDALWVQKKTNTQIQFPGNKVGRITRQGIEFLIRSGGKD